MTIVEVEAKKQRLEAEMALALEAAKVLTPVTPEFDDAYSRYLGAKANLAKIPEELAKAKLAENAVAIGAVAVQMSEGIGQLITALGLPELLGESVTLLRYTVNPEGVKTVVFNPHVVLRTAGAKKEGTGKRVQITGPDGAIVNMTKFVLLNSTEAEKSGFTTNNPPHLLVDSKPKFEAFCLKHNLA